MRAKRIPLVVIAFLSISLTVTAQDLSVKLEVDTVSRASAPRMVGDQLLFTYDFGPDSHDGRVHSVEIAFAHEEFSRLHAFERNQNNIYVFLYSVPADLNDIRYRLVVDGIWTIDPSNPMRAEDRWGVRLSRTTVPAVERTVTDAPIVHADGTVEFVVAAAPGSRVTVAGSFNGWDPFMTPLSETEPGRFSRRLRLGSGEHLYYYIV
ncbi:MAG: glycogen-binding domain-containing protein, partial [Spirochaetota bacterium]